MPTDINIGKTLRKCIVLNTLELTSKKQETVDSFFSEYLRVLNSTLEELPSAHSSLELHHLTYSAIRESSYLPSDIVEEARKDVWAKRKTVKNGFKHCSIRLNKRWFKFVKTDRDNPCFKITYSPKKTIIVPVKIDAHWNRLSSFLSDGWSFDNISLLSNNRIAVVLEKTFPPAVNNRRYILGVDVGSSTLAAITIYDTKEHKIMKQLYLGQDVAERQNWYLNRRAKLQHLTRKGSDKDKARKHLKKLKHDQSNFVNTRSGQVAKEIITLAEEYNASIAIENLKLRAKRKNVDKTKGEKKLNKKARTKINKIPFAKLRDFLKSNCERTQTPLDIIDAYHTSKWCPHCGSVNPGHDSKNYALYTCKTCGNIVNSDRKSSLAVAVKSLLERKYQGLTKPDSIQISRRRPPVTVVGLFRPCPDEACLSCAVHDNQPADGNASHVVRS